MDKKVLFLDRDGVINIDYGYVHKLEDFTFINGIFDLVKRANRLGYLVIIITNQSGIGRGYYSLSDFEVLCAWMIDRFKDKGAKINKIYYSPYHPTKGKGRFLKDDISRKPNPGMILKACDEFDIDLTNSILIGDKVSDITAGRRAGVGRNILFSQKGSRNGFDCINQLEDALCLLN